MEQDVPLLTKSWSLLWRVLIAAALGICLGAAGAWLESLAGTFWVAVALLPVAFLLEAALEIGAGALSQPGRKLKRFVIVVLVACYIGAWVVLRS